MILPDASIGIFHHTYWYGNVSSSAAVVLLSSPLERIPGSYLHVGNMESRCCSQVCDMGKTFNVLQLEWLFRVGNMEPKEIMFQLEWLFIQINVISRFGDSSNISDYSNLPNLK